MSALEIVVHRLEGTGYRFLKQGKPVITMKARLRLKQVSSTNMYTGGQLITPHTTSAALSFPTWMAKGLGLTRLSQLLLLFRAIATIRKPEENMPSIYS